MCTGLCRFCCTCKTAWSSHRFALCPPFLLLSILCASPSCLKLPPHFPSLYLPSNPSSLFSIKPFPFFISFFVCFSVYFPYSIFSFSKPFLSSPIDFSFLLPAPLFFHHSSIISDMLRFSVLQQQSKHPIESGGSFLDTS